MANPIYNSIGNGYNTTRKADPYLTDRLYHLLAPVHNVPYLDIGCGTGNYLQAMLQKGVDMVGIDPSETMLAAAKEKHLNTQLIQSDLEHIPFADHHFGGAMAVLTLHHWSNKLAGVQELRRVIKHNGNLIFFTFTPEQVYGYWLAHYFPKMIEFAANVIPSLAGMQTLLEQAGFEMVLTEPYSVHNDLQDHFMYSHKNRPEKYLLQSVRDGTSGFRLAPDQEEISQGMVQLELDISNGTIHEIMARYPGVLGDYLFIQAVAS